MSQPINNTSSPYYLPALRTAQIISGGIFLIITTIALCVIFSQWGNPNLGHYFIHQGLGFTVTLGPIGVLALGTLITTSILALRVIYTQKKSNEEIVSVSAPPPLTAPKEEEERVIQIIEGNGKKTIVTLKAKEVTIHLSPQPEKKEAEDLTAPTIVVEAPQEVDPPNSTQEEIHREPLKTSNELPISTEAKDNTIEHVTEAVIPPVMDQFSELFQVLLEVQDHFKSQKGFDDEQFVTLQHHMQFKLLEKLNLDQWVQQINQLIHSNATITNLTAGYKKESIQKPLADAKTLRHFKNLNEGFKKALEQDSDDSFKTLKSDIEKRSKWYYGGPTQDELKLLAFVKLFSFEELKKLDKMTLPSEALKKLVEDLSPLLQSKNSNKLALLPLLVSIRKELQKTVKRIESLNPNQTTSNNEVDDNYIFSHLQLADDLSQLESLSNMLETFTKKAPSISQDSKKEKSEETISKAPSIDLQKQKEIVQNSFKELKDFFKGGMKHTKFVASFIFSTVFNTNITDEQMKLLKITDQHTTKDLPKLIHQWLVTISEGDAPFHTLCTLIWEDLEKSVASNEEALKSSDLIIKGLHQENTRSKTLKKFFDLLVNQIGFTTEGENKIIEHLKKHCFNEKALCSLLAMKFQEYAQKMEITTLDDTQVKETINTAIGFHSQSNLGWLVLKANEKAHAYLGTADQFRKAIVDKNAESASTFLTKHYRQQDSKKVKENLEKLLGVVYENVIKHAIDSLTPDHPFRVTFFYLFLLLKVELQDLSIKAADCKSTDEFKEAFKRLVECVREGGKEIEEFLSSTNK